MVLKRFKKELKQAEGAKTALGRPELSKIGPKQPPGGQNNKNRVPAASGRPKTIKIGPKPPSGGQKQPKRAKTRSSTSIF
jgi:hypothetical protein